jgi:hypothetical protein
MELVKKSKKRLFSDFVPAKGFYGCYLFLTGSEKTLFFDFLTN